MRLPFEEQAAQELGTVARFYETERAGYGRLFLAEVSKKVARAAEFPQSGVGIGDTEPSWHVRAFVLSRFPYTVITAVVTGRRAVIAIAHHHRRPDYWKDRIE